MTNSRKKIKYLDSYKYYTTKQIQSKYFKFIQINKIDVLIKLSKPYFQHNSNYIWFISKSLGFIFLYWMLSNFHWVINNFHRVFNNFPESLTFSSESWITFPDFSGSSIESSTIFIESSTYSFTPPVSLPLPLFIQICLLNL